MPTITLPAQDIFVTLTTTSSDSFSNQSNMYTDTNSTTYGYFRTSASATSRQFALIYGGFDMSSANINRNCIINSLTLRVKGYRNSYVTPSTYTYLSGTVAAATCVARKSSNSFQYITTWGFSQNLSTATSTISYTLSSSSATATWGSFCDWVAGQGVEDGLYVALTFTTQQSSWGTQYAYVYLYGADLVVDYSDFPPVDVTTTIHGSGVYYNPLGTEATPGLEYTTWVFPTNRETDIRFYVNDVEDGQLHPYDSRSFQLLATSFYTLTTSPDAQFYLNAQTIANNFDLALHHPSNSPSSGSTFTYVKDGDQNTARGYAVYPFDYSFLPDDLTIDEVLVFAEARSEDGNDPAFLTLASGGPNIEDMVLYDSVSAPTTSQTNVVAGIDSAHTWTHAELANLKVLFEVGYNGGYITGLDVWVTATDPNGEMFCYGYTVIAEDGVDVNQDFYLSPTFYDKSSNIWGMIPVFRIYKKVNGSWVRQYYTDYPTTFDPTKNYQKGTST